MRTALLALVVAAQILQHNPVPCARTDGFLPDGTPIHACACHRMGHGDGEDCAPDHEPNDCAAYCEGDKCACPIECSVEAPT